MSSSGPNLTNYRVGSFDDVYVGDSNDVTTNILDLVANRQQDALAPLNTSIYATQVEVATLQTEIDTQSKTSD